MDRPDDHSRPVDRDAWLPSVRATLASLSLSMLLGSLDTSIANAGLPVLARTFEASFQAVQWVVLAYLLAVTTLIVSVGRLGDRIGRKRLLLAGIAVFTAASLGCGLAPNLPWLVAARAAQGLGSAIMMALTVAFVGRTVPKARTGVAMGLLGTMSAVGTTLGPSVGGLLTTHLGWRSMFLVNVPLGLLTLALSRRHLPTDPPAGPAGRTAFPGSGTAWLALTLAAYALATTLGHGSFGRLNLGLLLTAAVGLVIFLATQRRAAVQLIPFGLFEVPGLGAGLAVGMAVSTVIMATLVVGPFYLSRALDLDPARVGLALSAGPLAAVLSGIPAGRLVDRFGGPRMALAGLVGMTLGVVGLSLTPLRSGLPGYLAPLLVVTSHYALFQTANNTVIMSAAGAAQQGLVSGLLSLARNLGLVTGTSFMGAVFALASGAGDVAAAAPEAVSTGMRGTFAVAALFLVVATVSLAGRRHPAPMPCPDAGPGGRG